jgi:predicted ATPase
MNFRSVQDSEWFSVGDVTCLVGKNESGKTALLQALYRLNPYDVDAATFDKEVDYPRVYLADYAERHPDAEATVVETMWQLEPKDVAAVKAAICDDALLSDKVHIHRKYESSSQFWAFDLDMDAIVRHLAVKALLDEDDLAKIFEFKITVANAAAIDKMQDPSEPLKRLRTLIGAFRDNNANKAAIDAVSLPKFLYFSSYDKMNGIVSINQLVQDIANHQVKSGDDVFLDFLALARTSVEELTSATRFDTLTSKVEAASRNITKQIFEYWSQNRFLRVQFSLDTGFVGDPPPFNAGLVARTRIYNELHEVTGPFDDRSAGFVWFFSFLVRFSQVSKTRGDVIILLDEPGLNLHGKAQADLLRYFEDNLRSKHQLIYTTHSPFMVPPDRLTSVRTVEDVLTRRGEQTISLGTKVGDRVLSVDQDTLFPLQGALGYQITQSLLVAQNTLLVEGPSDAMIIQAASDELKRRHRVFLDPRWAVCPTSGIGNVAAFIGLFAGNKLNIVVLADFSKQDQAAVSRVREMLSDDRVITYNAFVDSNEATLEDLLGADVYATMLNGAYSLGSSDYHVTAEKLHAVSEHAPSLVAAVTDYFGHVPEEVAKFDRFSPALWLVSNAHTWENDANTALDRFESLFDAVNKFVV